MLLPTAAEGWHGPEYAFGMVVARPDEDGGLVARRVRDDTLAVQVSAERRVLAAGVCAQALCGAAAQEAEHEQTDEGEKHERESQNAEEEDEAVFGREHE